MQMYWTFLMFNLCLIFFFFLFFALWIQRLLVNFTWSYNSALKFGYEPFELFHEVGKVEDKNLICKHGFIERGMCFVRCDVAVECVCVF